MSIRTRVKIVTTKKGKIVYYLGDGFWFGRIAEKDALDNLAAAAVAHVGALLGPLA